MREQRRILIGAPIDSGKWRQGCLIGPDAYRTAGLAGALRTLRHRVTNLGNITAATVPPVNLDHSAYGLEETIGWAQSLAAAAQTAMADYIPVFLGAITRYHWGRLPG
jgi:arginase